MKKILFIDYPSFDGHIHSTRIQIEALKELGFEIYCVFKKGYIERHRLEGVVNYVEIPECLYSEKDSHIRYRIEYILSILYSRWHVKRNDWDHIIIQTYEPLSLFLAQSFKGSYIVDQNTASYVDRPSTRWMLQILSSSYKHVVFNSYQKEGLTKHGIKNVYVVPIGAHVIPECIDKSILDKYSLKENHFIFCPSATSVDHEFVARLCRDVLFLNYLRDNHIKMVVKKQYDVDKSYKDCILPLTQYLSEEDYNCLMRYSKFVLLSYLQSFTYRVSGVLLECIESKIKCLINNLPSFRAYEDYLKYKDIFYNNTEELVDLAKKIDGVNVQDMYLPFNSMASIKEAWINTFKESNHDNH